MYFTVHEIDPYACTVYTQNEWLFMHTYYNTVIFHHYVMCTVRLVLCRNWGVAIIISYFGNARKHNRMKDYYIGILKLAKACALQWYMDSRSSPATIVICHFVAISAFRTTLITIIFMYVRTTIYTHVHSIL